MKAVWPEYYICSYSCLPWLAQNFWKVVKIPDACLQRVETSLKSLENNETIRSQIPMTMEAFILFLFLFVSYSKQKPFQRNAKIDLPMTYLESSKAAETLFMLT